MAGINLTRSVEFANIKMWLFTEKEKVVTETVKMYKTNTGDWVLNAAHEYAKEKKVDLIKFAVESRGVDLMTLPLRDYVAIAGVKEEKHIEAGIVDTTETADTTEIAEQED